jgi:hypothetical protein
MFVLCRPADVFILVLNIGGRRLQPRGGAKLRSRRSAILSNRESVRFHLLPQP